MSRPRSVFSVEADKWRAGNAKHYQKKRAIIEALKAVPCLDCGNVFPPEAMDFDHVRGEKKFSIGGGRINRSLTSVLAEIEKCEIVCANCHRVRTRQRGQS